MTNTTTTSSFTDTPSPGATVSPPDNERRKQHFRVGAEDRKRGKERSENPFKTYHGGFRAAWFRGWDAQNTKQAEPAN